MPGLIDCHVHVVASMMNLGQNAAQPDPIAVLRSLPIMTGMLERGFTTVRDVGGAPPSLADAQMEGMIAGPKLVVCGKALSKTGGHVDFRTKYDTREAHRNDEAFGSLGRIADGVDEIRRACRQELRQGAKFIKAMANGGVASPTDPIEWFGYSEDELRVAVAEARDAGTYVSAHLYTAEAIKRAVTCGVHSLEHCNLIDEVNASLAAEAGAIAVPTLTTFEAQAKEGEHLGLPSTSRPKLDLVRSAGFKSLEVLRAAGVKMAYGTDLLGATHAYQNHEFLYRSEVLLPREILASATTVAAELVGAKGRLGQVLEGAVADLLVVAGNPLEDISILARPERHLLGVIQDGKIVVDRLH
ncbi:imidazolonepropionase-like amidohydrolase [Sinorhizobium terangae]|uniref:metal-dependent hydrolase family protein n=1 Tax=Sinorhizobium terangae TaxID=110322 RepID=UPI0017E7CE47|nr:amidohydrolase family protein [Sinorhizobium terangae]MBB4189243.1 imidazolonepropionase-like amidohydrolase [Sinorhizobium terangae]